MTYLLNLSVCLRNLGIEHSVVFYGDVVNDKIEKDVYVHYVQFGIYDGYRNKLSKLRDFVREDSIIIASDRVEIDLCNYFRLENLLIYVMHGDLKHYTFLLMEKVIDIRFFVSEQLSNKYSDDKSLRNVLFPVLQDPVRQPTILKDTHHDCGFSDKLRFAYVGRLEYEKGSDDILKLDKLIDVDWGFFITRVGSDLGFIEKVKSKTIEFDLTNSEVLCKLGTYDFLFFPSRSEGFGIAVVEAMSLGVLTIVRDIEMGVIQYLTNGLNTIKYEDVESLKFIIDCLDSREKQRMINEGYEILKTKFDKEIVIDRLFSQLDNWKRKEKKEFARISKDFSFYLPKWLYSSIKRRLVNGLD